MKKCLTLYKISQFNIEKEKEKEKENKMEIDILE